MEVISRAGSPATTRGFDAYWSFASERQRIYRAKLAGEHACMTGDPVIAANRFTNAYRASDRVSQYLVSVVQYGDDWNWLDTFVRTLVFKIFNRIDTWQHLVSDVGEPTAELLLTRELDVSLSKIADSRPIYSGAYIMPPPRNLPGPKYTRHLELIRTMVREGAHEQIMASPRMAQAYRVLRRYESIGDFLAYQYVTDLNYSEHLSFSESEFVVPGPGALRGLKKCFADPGDRSAPDLIRWTLERQHSEFEQRGLPWDGLWGRDLQLIDVQNLFCEVDKYTRVALPELATYASGDRIKQRYRPNPNGMTAWFPPKWGINHRIAVRPPAPPPAQLVLFNEASAQESELAAV